MLVKIITLVFSERLGGFDDTPVRDFVARHVVLKMRPEFFLKDGIPHWSILFSYDLSNEKLNESNSEKPSNLKKRIDWQSKVPEEKWNLFNELRDWRNEKGRTAGIPPYLVFTNKQLVEAITQNSYSLAGLAEIDGIGPSRVKKYGKDLLRILKANVDSEITSVNTYREGEKDE